MTRIFISYSFIQEDIARQMHEKLSAAGYDTWVYAVHGDRSTNTDEVMPTCDMQVVIIDNNSVTSPNVMIEIKRFAKAGKPIIPVMLEPLMLPDAIDKSLAVYDMDDLDDTAARLIDRIEHVLADRAEQRPTGTILLSYPRSEVEFATKLNNALEAAGYTTWFYADDHDPRRDREAQLNEVMQHAAMQIVVVTRHAAVQLYGGMRFEYEAMFIMGKPIIPVMLYPTELPKQLQSIPPADFTINFEQGMADLQQTIERVHASITDEKRVLVAYHDLTEVNSGMGMTDVARTIHEYLSSRGYTTTAVDFRTETFDTAWQSRLDQFNTVIVILSRITASYFTSDDNAFKLMLQYALGSNIDVIPVTVSSKFNFLYAVLKPLGMEHLYHTHNPLYIAPMYVPPEDAEKTLAPLMERLGDRDTEPSAAEQVIIAYHDLMGESSTMGPTNVARTITEYLPGAGYNAERVDFTKVTYDDALREKIDRASAFVIILSRTTIAYMTNDTDPLRVALEQAMAADKKIIPVAISRKRNLLGVEPFEPFQYQVVYIPPVYLPPENAEKTLAPLMAQLDGTVIASEPETAAPEVAAPPEPEPAAETLPLNDGLTHHIFLSYKRMDGDTMRQVRDDLRKRGFVVWTDELIEKGTPQWQREIERAIRNTATLVCLLSPEAAQSDYVREELAAAKMFKKPIFLAIIRGTREECFIYGFVNAQSTDLRMPDTYGKEFPLLAAAIKRRL